MNIIPATPAPEFREIKKWNDEKIHSIKQYKGKVVLLDFWTYTCIYCLRTIPTIEFLREKYGKQGLEIVSLHSAEYQFAKEEKNIKKALKEYNIDDFVTGYDISNKTWETYGNSYWPKHVLIDKDGFVRYEHAGYGVATEFEDALNDLLEIPQSPIQPEIKDANENPTSIDSKFDDQVQIRAPNKSESSYPQDRITKIYGMHFPGMAPEICVGYSRMRRFGNNQKVRIDEFSIFTDLPTIMDNVVYLKGKWIWEKEGIGVDLDYKEKSPSIIFKYNSASNVNIIAGSTDGKPSSAEIMLDGEYLRDEQIGYDSRIKDGISSIEIAWPHILNIVKTLNPESHKLEIRPKTNNFYFYTFVFG